MNQVSEKYLYHKKNNVNYSSKNCDKTFIRCLLKLFTLSTATFID